MRKHRCFAVIVCLLLACALSACGTITVLIPYENVAGYFQPAPSDGGAVPVDSDRTVDAGTSAQPIETLQPTDAVTAAPTEAPSSAAATTDAAATAAPTTTEAPSAAAPTEAPTTEPAAPVNAAPSTKEEIINYYVTGYNKIAGEAKSVVRTYDYTYQYNNILEINNNATLEKLAGTLMNQFMKENTSEVPGDAASLPPVGVTTLSIPSSLLSNATCEDKGDHYEVKLYSTGSDNNWEIDSQAGVGSAGVIGPLLRTEDVAGAAGGLIKFEGLHTWYSTAVVTAQMDKATGRITEFDFKTPCVLHFDQVTAAIVVKVSNCNLGMEFHQIWKITY